jgi:drug/metabolite transporter (DMT)-like permease
MIGLGAALGILSGAGFGTAAALQKREAVSVEGGAARVLVALSTHRVWVGAVLLEFGAWIAQVAALAMAPVALVVPLTSLGTLLLMALGVLWLRERFGRVEVGAVIAVVAGSTMAAVAVATTGTTAARAPLAATTQIGIAAAAAALAAGTVRTRSGLGYGAAAGFLYAATIVSTKEIGDRLAVSGWHGVVLLAASPAPWLLAVLSVAALGLTQKAFQRVNAATATSALTAVETAGPIVVGFTLYNERFPGGAAAVLLVMGLLLALGGLAAFTLGTKDDAPAGRPGQGDGDRSGWITASPSRPRRPEPSRPRTPRSTPDPPEAPHS